MKMSDFELTTNLRKNLKVKVSKSVRICGCHFGEYYALFFFDPLFKMLKFKENSFEESRIYSFEVICDAVKVVGYKQVFVLNKEGKIFEFCQLSNHSSKSYGFRQYLKLKFTKILAITEYKNCFACLAVIESGEKQLWIFDFECLPNVEDHTFEGLNANNSEDYYLKTAVRSGDWVSLIVSENASGKIYLCSNNGQSSLIYTSNSRLVSAISIVSEDCLSLWFENGKIYFHYFSQVCFNKILILNKKVVCVEKCFCNDKCFLWSDGGNLHHTEINFNEGKLTMMNFKLRHNIVGVISLIKVPNFIVVQTINDNLYELRPGSKVREELLKPSSEVFSQIYNESLKIKELHRDIEVASEYLKSKEMIQNDRANVKLVCDGGFLNIKNKSGMTFNREFWRIEVSLSDQGQTQVKIVELETDLVNGMTLKVKNPFQNYEIIKVYLTGQFYLEILSFCIGIISKEGDEENKSLKQILNKAIKIKNDLKLKY